MKLFTTLSFFSLIITSAFADQEIKTTYTKLTADTAQVVYETGKDGVSQAGSLVNGEQNQRFIQELLKDKNSQLAKLKAEIELQNCEENSTEENSYIDGCGEVELTSAVVTSFGRGGWASAGAGYTLFVGFRSAGTGRFLDSTHMLNFSESVEAMGEEGQEFEGTFLKTLSLDSIKKL